MALRNGSVDIALGMFQHMKKNEQPIRQHYFWPILVAKNKQNDMEGKLFVTIKIVLIG